MVQRISQYFGSALQNTTSGVNTASNLAVGFDTTSVAVSSTPFQVSGNASISGSLKVGTAVTINQTSGTISATFFDGAFSGIVTSAVNLVGGIATASQLQVNGISTFVGISTFGDGISVSGVSTFVGLSTFENGIYNAGVSTFVGLSTFENGIYNAGVSTFVGLSTFQNGIYVTGIATIQTLEFTNLNVSGITTVSNSGVNISDVYTVGVGTTVVTGTATTSIISLRGETFRSVKYQVQIAQGSDFQATDLLAIHNGTTSNLIEYGSVATGDYLGSFDSSLTNDFTAVVSAAGTVGISTDFITGINTSSIAIGQEVVGLSTVVSTGTTVVSIGIGTVGIGTTTLNTETQNNITFSFGSRTPNLNLNYTPNVGTAATVSIAYQGMKIIQ